jgi:hypothetical protein
MDSNHRTPKRTDLQSVAVGHLATCPTFQSHLPESNQRPTDYKSVALPAELKWQSFTYPAIPFTKLFGKSPGPIQRTSVHTNPPEFFGKAKVNEFVKSQNFDL